jgi:hypothetical protein
MRRAVSIAGAPPSGWFVAVMLPSCASVRILLPVARN